MKYIIVIPARLQSVRLPEKPLIDILGKSMIQRTYERCLLAVESPESVVIATDSTCIYDHAKKLKMNVLMTSDECLTGTDRVAEVAKQIDADYYINVQGDEPIINPEDIKKMIAILPEKGNVIFNGYTRISEETDYLSSSIPKVVFRNDKRLLYMSRSPIPGNKSMKFREGYRQICIYAFTKCSLIKFQELGKKTYFEDIEDIEILRFLELGFEVQMLEMSSKSIAVDNKFDLVKVINTLKR